MKSSSFLDKALGCLVGGVIGDAMGTPTERMTYQEIQQKFGVVNTFSGDGTDDSALKHILCDTIVAAKGYPDADRWAEEWLKNENLFLKTTLFYVPVMNAFWKLRGDKIEPREAGNGNMASSSSAMCISPMGIINAGNPRQAAIETYELVSLIHHNFCRDGACSMAAAVAEAFSAEATVASVIEAAIRYLAPKSSRVMLDAIDTTLALARSAGSYERFRERYYGELMMKGTAISDSRETVPVTLALLELGGGDPEKCIVYGANFGRDADTIASMVGALAGALRGASSLPAHWMADLGAQKAVQEKLARTMVAIAVDRARAAQRKALAVLELDG
jgi:ADP-ribosylglycohydrolase